MCVAAAAAASVHSLDLAARSLSSLLCSFIRSVAWEREQLSRSRETINVHYLLTLRAPWFFPENCHKLTTDQYITRIEWRRLASFVCFGRLGVVTSHLFVKVT